MGSSAAAGRGGERLPFADINGKTAVLTLGAEQYEGIHLAADLVKRGCRVVLLGCPISRVTKACKEVFTSAAGIQYDADSLKEIELDVARVGEHAVEEAVEKAWCAFGGIDISVSCASDLGSIKSVMETTERDVDTVISENVKAIWLVTKSVARKMQQNRRPGSVLFLTSISGTERGFFPGVSISGTSMAALNHLTKMMAMEFGKHGIRVNAIAYGLAEGHILLEGKDRKLLQGLANSVVPLQRWLQFPDDITGVVLWLAGDSSTFVTGTVTIVDGGLSLRRPRLGEYRSRL